MQDLDPGNRTQLNQQYIFALRVYLLTARLSWLGRYIYILKLGINNVIKIHCNK